MGAWDDSHVDYRRRQAAALERAKRGGVDALLLSHLPNIRYLTGFSGSNALLLLEERGAVLFTDGRYREQARQQAQSASIVVPRQGDLWNAAAKRAARMRRIGLELDHVTLAQRAHWPGSAKGIKSAGGWIEQLRSIKDEEEIDAIERAVRLASSVFAPTLRRLRAGMAETEAAGWLELGLRRAGGEGVAFDTILAGGARSALVHAQPSAAPLPRRGWVVMDYGVVLDGYHSDMTRTVHMGAASRQARQVYAAVAAAQAAAIAAVRAGVPCAVVDGAARQVLRRAGYGRYFPHSTGHGLGLEIHEAPRLAATSTERLRENQVITIEPGVYIPDWGGVRIEDVVRVRAQGCEILTPTPKDLIVL
ncbi:MAG: M24 family metallopeptidase [Terriglobales bacterium]